MSAYSNPVTSMQPATVHGFVRVSTGSQDSRTQTQTILAAYPQAEIIHTATKAASASKGEHLDAMDALIARLEPGDMVVVTDSSRLDRDPDQWAQMARLISIKAKGASVTDLSNPGFGSNDRFGVVMTALHQMENADKSRLVKTQTYRGISAIRDNKASLGHLPAFWVAQGARYAKQAVCTDPEAVKDIYERVAAGMSLSGIGRRHGDLYANSIKRLNRFEANMTGVIECRWTHDGQAETWLHEVTPVIEPSLFRAANKALDAPKSDRGGRGIAKLEK